jgi:broad specificity phosphatase PhoE
MRPGAPATKASFQMILVRHGVTDWNEDGRLMGRTEVELNDRGRQQAAAAAKAIAELPVGAVLSSPRPRTLQTAEPIARSHHCDVIVEPGFDEVWLDDAWVGKKVSELRGDPDLERLISDPSYRCERIESIEDVQSRCVAAAERVREERPTETVVIVSHGDPLRALLAYYLDLPLRSFRRLTVENGAVSILRFTPRSPRLLTLNWGQSLTL